MIRAEGLAKRYGAKTAVDDITFTVQPGVVTGFLGPNGAGKSTTMRMIVGLDRPSAGTVTVNGKSYAQHAAPLREVGALLDAKAIHTGRSAYNHLLAMGATHGIGKARVKEVIALTGLESVANKRVGGFSLGMGQRLGIAAALLGDPATLILDEPVNGLDPEGVMWVRNLARHLAREGRTVFLSSHLMSEMALTADHLIVLGRGRILADAPVAEILAASTRASVRLRSPQADRLAALLRGPDVTIAPLDEGALTVTGLAAAAIGDAAAGAGIPLHELTPIAASLEEAYMELTQDDVEYHAGGAASPATPSTPYQEVAR
jgi:ABC-2 type transport system ATP-binding protein